jgi:hypothetical protein
VGTRLKDSDRSIFEAWYIAQARDDAGPCDGRLTATGGSHDGQQTDSLPRLAPEFSQFLDKILGEFFAAKKQMAGGLVKCVQASIRVRADFAESRWCAVRRLAYIAAEPLRPIDDRDDIIVAISQGSANSTPLHDYTIERDVVRHLSQQWGH